MGDDDDDIDEFPEEEVGQNEFIIDDVNVSLPP